MTRSRTRLEAAGALIDALVDHVAVTLFLIMFAAVIVQIFLRYLFNSPLTWSEELSRYIFIWIALLGWTLASRNHTHIVVRMFVDLMPRPARYGMEVLNSVLVFGFCALLVFMGTKLAVRSSDLPTVTLFFTFGLVYAIVPIAGLVIMMQAVRDIVRLTRNFAAGR